MINDKPWEQLTPVEILIAAKEYFLENPLRLNMNFWILHGTPGTPIQKTKIQVFPECGTVGCIAGIGRMLGQPPHGVGLKEAMKLNERQCDQLFYVHYWPYKFAEPYILAEKNRYYDTQAHILSRYIEWFINVEFFL